MTSSAGSNASAGGTGGILASASIPLIENRFSYGIILALLSYSLIGFGVGAAGTPLLALLATYSSKSQKGFAASITFLMMILGLAITGITVGTMLDPYSHQKLIKITSSLAIITNIISFLSLRNLERSLQNSSNALTPNTINSDVPILEGIKKVWMEREARLFTIFIFISMGAFSMQDPILELKQSPETFPKPFGLHLGFHWVSKTVILHGRGIKNQHFHFFHS